MSRAIMVINGTLKCARCGEVKLVSEFSKGKNKSGYKSYCKECVHKEYLANKDHILKQHKEYYENNKSNYLGMCRKYREEHKEHTKEVMRNYYLRNGDKIRKRSKERFANFTPEQMKKRKEYLHNYYTTEEGRAYKRMKFHFRKAQELNVENTLSSEEWEDTVTFFNGECAYCGRKTKLTQDHVIPVSKGGGYTKYNIVPCCGRCNSSKQDKDYIEWYKSKPFFSESRLNRINELMRLYNGSRTV